MSSDAHDGIATAGCCNPMHARAFMRVATWKGIGAAGHAVLSGLLWHCDGHLIARPSVAGLAELAGVSERSAQYALRQLEAAGIVHTLGFRGERSSYVLGNIHALLAELAGEATCLQTNE